MSSSVTSYKIAPDGTGDEIHAVEITHGNGAKSVKVYLSKTGLRSGLKSVQADIDYWSHHNVPDSWIPTSCRVLTAAPNWSEV